MKLNFKKFGEGDTTLIILHGLLGSLDNWQSLAKRFGAHYTVYTLDQRNHGQSFHADSMDYQLMSEDLHLFINKEELERPILLGHSMGGKTVMRYAFDFPDTIKGLIVADISPKAYPVHHQNILDALSSVDFNIVRSRKEVEEQLFERLNDRGVVFFLAKNVFWKEKDRLAFRFNLKAIQAGIEAISGWGQEGVYSGPTLFLRGGKSNYLGTIEEAVENQFPTAEIHTIADAGHWLHADQPDRFFEEVTGFVSNL